jgi:hypothetical protein
MIVRTVLNRFFRSAGPDGTSIKEDFLYDNVTERTTLQHISHVIKFPRGFPLTS